MRIIAIWLFLVLSVPMIAQNQKENRDFALLIGIDEYAHMPAFNLDGCANDVDIFRQMLVKRFGFLDPASQKDLPDDKKNIVTLLNKQATRENILAQFRLLEQKAINNPGAKVVLFYSGHGSQKKDDTKHPDEDDGLDETIVSHDSTMEDGEKDISDDEINALFKNLVNAGAHVTAVWDCCHSGTGNRGNTKSRSLKRNIKPVKVRVTPEANVPNVVFLSACKAEEKEPEYFSKDSEQTYGTLTYHMVKAIEEINKPEIRWDTLFTKINSYYANIPQAPTPTLEGNRNNLIFQKKSIKYDQKARVKKVYRYRNKPARFILDRGSLLGVTVGSIFCLTSEPALLAENKVPEKHLLVMVNRTKPFVCSARTLTAEEREELIESLKVEKLEALALDNAGPEEAENWQAVELMHDYGDLRLALYIEREKLIGKGKEREAKGFALTMDNLAKDEPQLHKIIQNMIDANVITIVEKAKQAQAILRLGNEIAVLVWPQGGVEAEFTLPEQGQPYEPKGFGPFSLQNPDKGKIKLSDYLIHFNKVRNLVALSAPRSFLEHKVTAQLVEVEEEEEGWVERRNDRGQPEVIFGNEGLPQFAHRRLFGVLLTNNTEKTQLYITVLYIDYNLGVTVWLPEESGQKVMVKPGENVLVPPFELDNSEGSGRETVKIIVSNEYHDFSELGLKTLSKTRSKEVRIVEKSVLGNLVFQSAFGKKRAARTRLRAAGKKKNKLQWAVFTLGWIALEKSENNEENQSDEEEEEDW